MDPRRAIRTLYRGLDGYDVSDAAEAVVLRHRSSPLYGELMPGGVAGMLEHLRLTSRDVLYDLGSGVGKVILQSAMTHRLKACVGIELVRPRHAMAQEALARAESRGLLLTRDVRLIEGDFMRLDLSEATVVYTCSTAFPLSLMHRLVRRLARHPTIERVVTVQDLDENRWFEEQAVLRLDMSWRRRARVYVYRRRQPMTAARRGAGPRTRPGTC